MTKQIEATPSANLTERRCMLFQRYHRGGGNSLFAAVTAIGTDTQERRAAELVSNELSDTSSCNTIRVSSPTSASLRSV